jgi:hypothetical protein
MKSSSNSVAADQPCEVCTELDYIAAGNDVVDLRAAVRRGPQRESSLHGSTVWKQVAERRAELRRRLVRHQREHDHAPLLLSLR